MREYIGTTMRTSCPRLARKRPSAATTSASPPVLAKGVHSEETRQSLRGRMAGELYGTRHYSPRFAATGVRVAPDGERPNRGEECRVPYHRGRFGRGLGDFFGTSSPARSSRLFFTAALRRCGRRPSSAASRA